MLWQRVSSLLEYFHSSKMTSPIKRKWAIYLLLCSVSYLTCTYVCIEYQYVDLHTHYCFPHTCTLTHSVLLSGFVCRLSPYSGLHSSTLHIPAFHRPGRTHSLCSQWWTFKTLQIDYNYNFVSNNILNTLATIPILTLWECFIVKKCMINLDL